MKLEGASSGPFQTIMLIGIEDPEVLSNLETFLAPMHARLSHPCCTTGSTPSNGLIGVNGGDQQGGARPYHCGTMLI